jgi:hypothetical protein
MFQFTKSLFAAGARLTEGSATYAGSVDRTKWVHYAQSLGTPAREWGAMLPDFLVVSPAKTGTSWLFEHLRDHPQILVPPQKEVRYFDAYWRTRDVDWYCAQFSRQRGQLAGDISPTYALLPTFAIKLISMLKPDLKIVLLLREPVGRAWSHLRHTFQYREANFAGYEGDFAELSLEDLICNLVDDFTLSSGDYESIVSRWSTHFPREQFHIAFFEDAVTKPAQYFASLLRFLGAAPSGSLERRPLQQVIFPGLQIEVPDALKPWLHWLYQPRRRRSEQLLLRKFGLKAPWPKAPVLDGPARLPEFFDGWVVELHDGRFRAWRKSDDMPGPDGLGVAFIGDLVDQLAPHITRQETLLRRAGFSREDCRLTRAIDALSRPNPVAN